MKLYQQRLIDEKTQLDIKAKALSNFIGLSDEFDNVEPKEQEFMREQCEIMWHYSEILASRIAMFSDS